MKKQKDFLDEPLDWVVSKDYIDYLEAVAHMKAQVSGMQKEVLPEQVWLLEHPPLYTMGARSRAEDLLEKNSLPVYETGRGGQITYHGPGQRVGYVMLNLKKRSQDLRKYIQTLEELVILTLQAFNLKTERRSGRIGLWVVHEDGSEEKIAAIGVRVEKWISYHGFAINVNPNLEHFKGIVPCGIKDYGVTSLEKCGIHLTMQELDQALQHQFHKLF